MNGCAFTGCRLHAEFAADHFDALPHAEQSQPLAAPGNQHALDLKGLAVSTGAACSSGALEPSHVLLAMGLKPERARASIRFSLGKQNTGEDVEFAVELVRETVGRLRELSPVWPKATASR